MDSADSYPPRRAAWYALLVLTLCYTFSFIDRQILAFLVGPLKQELAISDTQIGLLQGLAFAVFYTFFGLPIGRLADRLSRRNIIIAGLLLWSTMTALSGAARSYLALAAARMGVGVGEATINPCAFSMIADYFPKERLSSAMSVYMMGIQLGSGLALVIGGIVVQAITQMPPIHLGNLGPVAPWRLTFFAVGLPGILFAVLLLSVKEPPRRTPPGARALVSGGPASVVPISETLAFVASRWQSVIGIGLMIGCQAMSNYALLGWGPTFFERVHSWPKSQSGLVLGLITLGSGCTALYAGGRLADRWQRNGTTDGTLRVNLIGLIGVGITMPLALLLPSAGATVAVLVVTVFFVGLPIGCSYAALQLIFPSQMRGLASSIVLFLVNLVGLGLGSLLPGLFNDYLFRDGLKVGDSIALTAALAGFTGSVIVALTLKPYRRHYALLHAAA